jgi:hypothetical protein
MSFPPPTLMSGVNDEAAAVENDGRGRDCVADITWCCGC